MSRVKAPPPAFAHMQDRPGRWKLLWRKQRELLRPAIVGCVVVGVVLIGSVVVQAIGRGASFSERVADTTGRLGFAVQTIRIEGRQKTPEAMVRAALGVSAGDPILGFSVSEARARLETITWVQSATVERRLPGTIVVQLVERRPFAVWQNEGKFSLVDRDGGIVTDSDVAVFAGQLPLVVGQGAPKAAAALLELLAAQPDVQAHLVAAVRVGDRRWNLRMNNGADVMLPEGAEAAALAKLAALQASHALLDRPLAVIDLRLPDRLVVRPAGDAPKPQRKPA